MCAYICAVADVMPTLSGPCFAGPSIQPWQYPESCATCAGPGSSQCLSCADQHAFVIARYRHGVPEGWCFAFVEDPTETTSMKLLAMPPNPNYSPALAIQEHYLSKFGLTMAELPMQMPVQLGGSEMVHAQLNVVCRVQKREVCAARSSVEDPTDCTVSKSAAFVMVSRLRSKDVKGSDACTSCVNEKMCQHHGSPNNEKNNHADCNNADICCDIDVDGIELFFDIDASDPAKLPSPHVFCDSVVKLL